MSYICSDVSNDKRYDLYSNIEKNKTEHGDRYKTNNELCIYSNWIMLDLFHGAITYKVVVVFRRCRGMIARILIKQDFILCLRGVISNHIGYFLYSLCRNHNSRPFLIDDLSPGF